MPKLRNDTLRALEYTISHIFINDVSVPAVAQYGDAVEGDALMAADAPDEEYSG